MPWISIWPTPSGEVFPCCASAVPLSRIGDLGKNSLTEIVNSGEMKALRKKFLTGELDSEICRKCIVREKTQGSSLRTMIHDDFHIDQEQLRSQTSPEGAFEQFKIRFMDFVWSNKCNFACVHCTPKVSSSIASQPELRKFYQYEGRPIRSLSAINPELVSEILTNIDQVEVVHLNGGEPLVIAEHYRILEYLINIGRTDIKIWIHTNGSILDYKGKKIVDYLQYFPKTTVSLSHDGFSEHGEYFRYGYSDEIFLEIFNNLNKSVLEIRPSVCVHALNVFHFPDLLLWYMEKNLMNLSRVPSINIVTDPDFMSLDTLDYNTRLKAGRKYDKFLSQHGLKLHKLIRTRVQKIRDELLREVLDTDLSQKAQDKLRKYLEIKRDVFKQDAHILLKEHTIFFDRIGYKSIGSFK